MIKPDDFMTAIKDALAEQFPGETPYENRTPKNFSRPSNLVELISIRLGAIRPNAVTLLFSYKITDFVKVDDHYNSDTALLDFRTMMIVGGVFGAGYLKVGDRAPRVESTKTEHNFDYTETTVVLSLTYDRSEFLPSETLPIMEQLQMKFKEASE